LHARYGLPCELLGIGKHSVELYRDQPDVSDVVSLLAHHRPFGLSPEQWRVVPWLRQMRDRPVYVAEPQPRALERIRALLKRAGIPETHCVFLNDIPLPEAGHWIEHLLMLADATPPAFRDSYEQVIAPTSHVPAFHVSAQDRADCDQWLHSRGLSGHPLVLLQPANKRTIRWNGVRKASDDDKSWPLDHWAKVAAAVHAELPQARMLLCGSPTEADYLESIRTGMAQPHVEVVARELPLPRLRALLGIAHSMISVDTGPAHMAAAMGCPLVVMFGSVAPAHWAPRTLAANAVQVLGGAPRSRRVDAITSDEVINAWRGLPLRDASTPDVHRVDVSA
jgi:ADP-heptose:LPS heptosyltransferase